MDKYWNDYVSPAMIQGPLILVLILKFPYRSPGKSLTSSTTSGCRQKTKAVRMSLPNTGRLRMTGEGQKGNEALSVSCECISLLQNFFTILGLTNGVKCSNIVTNQSTE